MREKNGDEKIITTSSTAAISVDLAQASQVEGPYTQVEEKQSIPTSTLYFKNSPAQLKSDKGIFKKISVINSGNDGEVVLYQCEESKCQQVKNGEYVVIKSWKDKKEMSLEIDNSEKIKDKIKDKKNFIHFIPLKDNDTNEQCGAFSRFIYYEENKKGNFESTSLGAYMKQLYFKCGLILSSEKKVEVFDYSTTEFFYRNPSIFLSFIYSSLKKSQENLHEAGFIHLDIAARNCMVDKPILSDNAIVGIPIVFIDYTRTQNIEDAKLSNTVIPFKWTDIDGILYNKATVNTDLFALKATLIEMVGLAVGASTEVSVLKLPKFEFNDEYQSDARSRLKSSSATLISLDEERLTEYFKSASEFLENSVFKEKNSEQYHQIKIFLDAYRSYLTTMPNQKMSDKELFLKCTDSFVEKTYQHALSKLDVSKDNSINDFLLLRKRLLTHEVSKEFLKSDVYQKISTLDSSDKLRKYFNKAPEEISTSSMSMKK